jgi:hypothetical protein
LPDNDIGLLKDWIDSLIRNKVHGILFHNNYSETAYLPYKQDYIRFIKINYTGLYNANVFRYFVYQQFLEQYKQHIEAFFITDVSDVVMLQNPFEQILFKNNPNNIFCGDEPKPLYNEWMQAHAQHLRNQITDYADYEKKFADMPLLNCGIIGGQLNGMLSFIQELCVIHKQYNSNNQTLYTGDMGAFNYLMRTQYNNQLIHGSPVNTIFKAYETHRTDCWFRHK